MMNGTAHCRAQLRCRQFLRDSTSERAGTRLFVAEVSRDIAKLADLRDEVAQVGGTMNRHVRHFYGPTSTRMDATHVRGSLPAKSPIFRDGMALRFSSRTLTDSEIAPSADAAGQFQFAGSVPCAGLCR